MRTRVYIALIIGLATIGQESQAQVAAWYYLPNADGRVVSGLFGPRRLGGKLVSPPGATWVRSGSNVVAPVVPSVATESWDPWWNGTAQSALPLAYQMPTVPSPAIRPAVAAMRVPIRLYQPEQTQPAQVAVIVAPTQTAAAPIQTTAAAPLRPRPVFNLPSQPAEEVAGRTFRDSSSQEAPGPPARGPIPYRVGYTPLQPLSGSAAKAARRLERTERIQKVSPTTVAMENGFVVLRGVVGSDSDRVMAEQLVRMEPGIWNVRNELEVAGAAGVATVPPTIR